MDDLIMKGVVSVAALYAAANPWFRHHNTADPADLAAAAAIFLVCLFGIGKDAGTLVLGLCSGILVLCALAHGVFLMRKIRIIVIFGAGKQRAEAVHALVLRLAAEAMIPPYALSHDPARPLLVRIAGPYAKPAAQFNKQLDKALRPVLGLAFARFYPATLAVFTFLAVVWRFL